MRPGVLLLAVLALAACGGGDEPRETATVVPTTTPAATPDPADVMRQFVEAAAQGNANRFLTEEARARNLETELAEGVGSFAGTDYEVIVDELWDDVAIVAIAGEREVEGMRELGVFAAPLVREEGEWRVDVLSEPRMELDGTEAVRVDADEVRMWVDGAEVEVEREGDLWRPADPLEPGEHAFVAAARKGAEVSALGWKGVVGPSP